MWEPTEFETSYETTSSLNAKQTIAFSWPLYSRLISPVLTLQSLALLSEEAGRKMKANISKVKFVFVGK